MGKETSYKANIFIGRIVNVQVQGNLLRCSTETPLGFSHVTLRFSGRFLRPISADDVLFGNTFDRPLKLPWGSGAALKFMQ